MRISDLHRRILAQKVPLLLDLYPNASSALSLRKLSSSYTGPAIRVRRSSDNTEQDIGFVGGVVDTASLLSFVGAGSGFVRTWYDQSGNLKNGEQATNANQPQIVDLGVVNLANGKPSLVFDGINDSLVINIYTTNTLSCFHASLRTTNNNFAIYQQTNRIELGAIAGFAWNFASQFNTTVVASGPPTVAYTTTARTNLASNTFTLIYSYYNNIINQIGHARDNSSINTASTIGTLRTSGATTDNFFSGRMSEAIIYFSDQLATQSEIRSNINSFYNIY
jgi:hypothetical protein